MRTPIFSGKLDALPATLDLFRSFDPDGLADALARGRGRHALSIGSGGSAIAAEYLARCRDTLGLGPTTVQTPMQAVLEHHALVGSDVWLFSAGGDNPDAIAVARAALDRGARALFLVTRNPESGAGRIIEAAGGGVHVLPVWDPKDSYLATHSLLSSVIALLLASDIASREPRGAVQLLDSAVSRLASMRSMAARESLSAVLGGLQRSDLVLLVGDPLLRAASMLIETSLWESALCPVQATDFRNLAHGRHAWLHHQPGATFLLALTGTDSRLAWSSINDVLPSRLPRLTLDYGASGRLDCCLAIIDALGIVEAVGEVFGIDPGKPGIGDFGRAIYGNGALSQWVEELPPGPRQKRAAIARSDASGSEGDSLSALGARWLETLRLAEIGGLVFDYDGTVVTTEGRFDVPEEAIVDELIRLHGAGLAIGFSTGRGGSAGEDLRKVLPPEMLPRVLIGYFNGGHIRPASVDIDLDRPAADPAVAEAADWLRAHRDLFVDAVFKQREVQLTIDMDRLRRPYRFSMDLLECPPFRDGKVRVCASGHSYDLVPSSASKMAVVDRLRAAIPAQAKVLCFGDSGAGWGNDHQLLAHEFGISVGEVCSGPNGCWSLFGADPIGPRALLKILRCLIPSSDGWMRLDISSLGLDRSLLIGT